MNKRLLASTSYSSYVHIDTQTYIHEYTHSPDAEITFKISLFEFCK